MKILIVDDHAVVRQGYSSLIAVMLKSSELFEAGSGEEALTLYSEQQPDLVILDINLPGISGIETARRILEKDSLARILFFSMYVDSSVIRQALDAGARGYISKSSSPDILLEAVKQVQLGGRYVEQGLISLLSDEQHPDQRFKDMTQREFEVFVMLAKGASVKEIADKLSVSAKTVSNNTALLKSKLAVETTAELVHLAISCGLVGVGQKQA